MTVAESLVKVIREIGIDTVAGVPGSYILPLYDALRKEGVRTILLHDETAAGAIMDGYYKVSGRPLCCCATAGPGAVRLADGLYVPGAEKSACLSVTGMIPQGFAGRGALQEACGGRFPDQGAYLNESCKLSRTVSSVAVFREALSETVEALFSSPPGPVNLTIPVSILNEPFSGELSSLIPERISSSDQDPQRPEDLILSNLESADRPLIIAGGGIFDCRGGALLESFAAKGGIPVATTLRGKGTLNELHPASLGCAGMFGQNAANRYWREADLIVVLGASLGEMTTQAWDPGFFEGKRIILVDRSPGRAFLKAEVIPVESELRPFLMAMNEARLPFREDLLSKAQRLKRKSGQFKKIEGESSPLHPVEVMDELRSFFNSDVYLVTESITWTERWLPAANSRYICGGNAATLGYGVASLGVKLAAPESAVLCVIGDGGFRYCIGALEVSRRHNIAVTWLILDNSCMAAIRDGQRNLFGESHSCDFDELTDLTTVAKGFGVNAMRVTTRKALHTALRESLYSGSTSVIVVNVSDAAPPHKPSMGRVIRRDWGHDPARLLNPYAFKTMARSRGEI